MFDISIADDGTVFLKGRLDASQVEKATAGFEPVVSDATVDFSGLDYISSAGISVLLRVYKRLSDKGARLRFVNLTQSVGNVFRYAGLEKVFIIETN